MPVTDDPHVAGVARSAPRISVVLVNWNGAEFTGPCLASLLSGTLQPAQIIVVDNASDDGSPAAIAEKYPQVDLIRNSANLGFTGANNIGIQRALAAGADFVWVLNNDTVVAPDCLARLLATMSLDPQLAATSGKILYDDPDSALWYAGGTISGWTLRAKHTGQGDLDRGQHDAARHVDFISGCCMLVRRTALQAVGLFDDRFFAYSEDLDWCVRARRLGLTLMYVPEARLWHRVGASVTKAHGSCYGGTTSPFSVYITNRNRLFIIRKHARHARCWVSARLAYALCIVYWASGLLLLGRWAKAASLLRGCWDGMTAPLSQTESEESG